jgi:hypothetical protein
MGSNRELVESLLVEGTLVCGAAVALKLVLGDEAGEAAVAVEDHAVLDEVQRHEEHLLRAGVALLVSLSVESAAGEALDEVVVLDEVRLEPGLLHVLGGTVGALEFLFEVLALHVSLVVLSPLELLGTEVAVESLSGV